MAIPSLMSLLERRDISGVVSNTISYLSSQKDSKILFITTSTRYPFNTGYDKGGLDNELPKSTELALYIKQQISNTSSWLDIPQLNILPCEGNVSHRDGNTCGVKDSKLKDKSKNPTGNHRCWASVNDKSDELWEVSKELFDCDIVLFFSSIRWGQTNSEYQKLIERLTWLENRHNTLGEDNLLRNKQAGFMCIGQNWNGLNVVNVQKKVLNFYGFQTPDNLFWNWQYTTDTKDETQESYKKAYQSFKDELNLPDKEIKN